MKELKVCVIIPCHNHAGFIKNALDSIHKQNYQNKVVAVVDDGSTDNSREVIDQLQNSYDGMKIYLFGNNSPTGPSAARNTGIKLMMDNVPDIAAFAMLDADDEYLPGKLSKCMSVINNDPNAVGIVYNDVLIKDLRTGRVVEEYKEPFDRRRLEEECIITNAAVVSKLALEQCGLYDEEMRTCEDWDLWLRITEKFVAVHIPEVLHLYNVTGLNSSFTVNQEVWQKNWRRIYEKMQQRRQRRI